VLTNGLVHFSKRSEKVIDNIFFFITEGRARPKLTTSGGYAPNCRENMVLHQQIFPVSRINHIHLSSVVFSQQGIRTSWLCEYLLDFRHAYPHFRIAAVAVYLTAFISPVFA